MNIQTNNVTLFYEKQGAGAPLLLLHGNGEDHTIFGPLAKALAAHFTVYAIDSRNHGQSSRADDYSYAAMAADIDGLIAALDLGTVNLIGFSDGAIIGLMLAMHNPAVLRKMALLGINLSPEDFTEDSLQFIRDTYDETGDPLYKLMLEEPNIPIDDVHAVQTPTLLFAAEDDIFKPESFQTLAAAMPNAALTIVKEHDHGSYIVGNDMLAPDLLKFFG